MNKLCSLTNPFGIQDADLYYKLLISVGLVTMRYATRKDAWNRFGIRHKNVALMLNDRQYITGKREYFVWLRRCDKPASGSKTDGKAMPDISMISEKQKQAPLCTTIIDTFAMNIIKTYTKSNK